MKIERIPMWGRILLVLLVFGLIRTPFETSLRKKMRETNMLLPTPGPTAVTQLGQSALMGTLGGLRSLIATFYVLESFTHFENDDWDENKKALVLATVLEPTEESHWVSLVWNRGINAPAWLETRAKLPEFEKQLRYKEYTLDAVELGRQGLKQLPDAIDLRVQIAEVYKEKIKDPCGVAEMYGELLKMERAPAYSSRFYGYFLSECKGREREAYEHLVNLFWESPRNHLPTLRKKIMILQEQLDIPYPRRIGLLDPDSRAELELYKKKQRNRMPRKLPGGLVIP